MVTEHRPAAGDTTDHDRPAHRFSILIADDDRGNREALGEVLKNRGFNIVLAADGGEAVEIVQVELVHLVLFDMHMPRLTGLEAVDLLRHSLGKVLPAVLMTADATTELMRKAFQAHVYSVIPKPVNKNIVLHTLAKALTQVYGPPPDPARPHLPNPTRATLPDHGQGQPPGPPRDTDVA